MKNSAIQFCVYPQSDQCTSSIAASQRGSLGVDPQELQALFQAGAFWAQERNLEDLETALRNSKPFVTARSGHELVGFARATSDGVYRATIWDVIVHPDYQGHGIGRKVVETLLSHPFLCRVERVYLMTTYQEKFYERVGFQRNASTTMVLHNHAVYNSAADIGRASDLTAANLSEANLSEAHLSASDLSPSDIAELEQIRA